MSAKTIFSTAYFILSSITHPIFLHIPLPSFSAVISRSQKSSRSIFGRHPHTQTAPSENGHNWSFHAPVDAPCPGTPTSFRISCIYAFSTSSFLYFNLMCPIIYLLPALGLLFYTTIYFLQAAGNFYFSGFSLLLNTALVL